MSNIKIYAFLDQNGKITNQDIREKFKLSDEGILKEIKKLVVLEIVKSEEKERDLHLKYFTHEN